MPQVAKGSHAVIILDGAGWHRTGGRPRVPSNIGLPHPPAYSPQLNPQENARQYLRQNQLANRGCENHDDIVKACCHAWNSLMDRPERVKSIGNRDYAAVIV